MGTCSNLNYRNKAYQVHSHEDCSLHFSSFESLSLTHYLILKMSNKKVHTVTATGLQINLPLSDEENDFALSTLCSQYDYKMSFLKFTQ